MHPQHYLGDNKSLRELVQYNIISTRVMLRSLDWSSYCVKWDTPIMYIHSAEPKRTHNKQTAYGLCDLSCAFQSSWGYQVPPFLIFLVSSSQPSYIHLPLKHPYHIYWTTLSTLKTSSSRSLRDSVEFKIVLKTPKKLNPSQRHISEKSVSVATFLESWHI